MEEGRKEGWEVGRKNSGYCGEDVKKKKYIRIIKLKQSSII